MSYSGMIDWKGSLQLFANVAGLVAMGALVALAAEGVLRGPFTIEYGYLPLLGTLFAGAMAVGVRTIIGGP